MLRDYYFHMIKRQRYTEDQPICLQILETLTKGGQNLTYIEEQVSTDVRSALSVSVV